MRTSRQTRAGVAATELAIVLPLLLLALFGCVDFGRVAHVSVALNNAVGVGVAAYAALGLWFHPYVIGVPVFGA